MIASEESRLTTSSIEQALGHLLNEAQRDLLDVVLDVLMEDRTTSRSDLRWNRQLEVSLRVRNVAKWQGEAGDILHRLLSWITDDEWSIRVLPRRRIDHEPPQRLPGMRGDLVPACVALNSGGLDAFCGPLLGGVPRDQDLILVSGQNNPRMTKPQQEVLRGLQLIFPRARRVAVTVPSSQAASGRRECESSQRTRPMLYMALSAVIAVAHEQAEVRAHENAIGSLNLPILRSQTSTQVSRAMHPRTLRLLSELFRAALGRRVDLINPAGLMTKSEMCKAVPSQLHPAMQATTSCDKAYSLRQSGAPLCGACASCLLRRQSLLAAGLDRVDAAGHYAFDLVRGADLSDSRARVFLAHRLQVRRIQKAVSAPNPSTALLGAFPELLHLTDTGSSSPTVQGLSESVTPYLPALTAHVAEWFDFERRVLEAAPDGDAIDADSGWQMSLNDESLLLGGVFA